MNHSQCFAAPQWASRLVLLSCLGVLLCGAATASAQNVVRVEEDWELIVAEADVPSVAPQVTTSMSPTNNLNDTYFTFEINHKSVPSFVAGGLHLHLWDGEWRVATYSRLDQAVMNSSNERITWTQTLEAANGRLKFEIVNGVSSTWGIFGYSGTVKVDRSWSLGHVNGYTPSVSVAQSGVGFSANRVTSLKLLRIRMTLSDGEVLEDNTVRIVYQ